MLTENYWKGILINSPIHFELGDINTLAEYLADVSNDAKPIVSGSLPLDDENRGCPCMYLDEPCHPNCTCRNGYSSVGCMYCCRYGSKEQRVAMANHIAEKLRK
jgi:hypothetical protein